jgi:hypothetical protein
MKSPVPPRAAQFAFTGPRPRPPLGQRFATGLLHALLAAAAPGAFLPAAAATPPAYPLATPVSYELHPDLELSLFASEPDVVDPVSLAFDELGRAYVVEMRDYPYGFGPDRKPGGTVRLLEDTNGDGRADCSSLFAEGLSYPTSVIAWNGGVLVMAPP